MRKYLDNKKVAVVAGFAVGFVLGRNYDFSITFNKVEK